MEFRNYDVALLPREGLGARILIFSRYAESYLDRLQLNKTSEFAIYVVEVATSYSCPSETPAKTRWNNYAVIYANAVFNNYAVILHYATFLLS